MSTFTDYTRPDPDRLLTLDQAAKMAGRSRRTIERAIARGELPALRVGGGRGYPRIDPADLELAMTPRPTNPPGRWRLKADRGFTLIELLVVVIVIGIIAGVAIPVFMNQKAKAYDSSVRSDLSSVAKAVETALADRTGAVSRVGSSVTVAGGGTAPVTTSAGVTWDVVGTGSAYCALAWRTDGKGRYSPTSPLVWDATRGGTVAGADCASIAGLPAGWTTGGAPGTGVVVPAETGPLMELVYNLDAPGCTSWTITLLVTGYAGTGGTVDWGDGTSVPLGINASHSYSTPGVHTVQVRGRVMSLYSYGAAAASAPCLVGVTRWIDTINTSSSVSLQFAFYGATNLTEVSAPPYRITGTLQGAFRNATKFNGNIAGWNTSAVTNMNAMFYGAAAFSRDLSAWDVGAVTSHTSFATGAGALTQPAWAS